MSTYLHMNAWREILARGFDGQEMQPNVSPAWLINPATRNNLKTLTVAAFLVFGAIWIDKGIGMMVGGFTPSPLGEATSYIPTLPEIGLVIAIYAMGALVLTLLYKMAVTVKAETAQEKTA